MSPYVWCCNVQINKRNQIYEQATKNTRKKDDDNGHKMINYVMSVVRDFLDLTDTDLIAFLMADTKISWVSGFARTSQTIIRNCNDCPYGVSC